MVGPEDEISDDKILLQEAKLQNSNSNIRLQAATERVAPCDYNSHKNYLTFDAPDLIGQPELTPDGKKTASLIEVHVIQKEDEKEQHS